MNSSRVCQRWQRCLRYWQRSIFVANAATMKTIEPSLDWGGKLTFVVGDAATAGDQQTVCLSEASKSGKVFQIAAVDTGPNAGIWLGKSATGCPANDGSGANLKALGATTSIDRASLNPGRLSWAHHPCAADHKRAPICCGFRWSSQRFVECV